MSEIHHAIATGLAKEFKAKCTPITDINKPPYTNWYRWEWHNRRLRIKHHAIIAITDGNIHLANIHGPGIPLNDPNLIKQLHTAIIERIDDTIEHSYFATHKQRQRRKYKIKKLIKCPKSTTQ